MRTSRPGVTELRRISPWVKGSAPRPRPRDRVIAVGDVLTLHDVDTGASAKSVVRPCVVLAVGSTIVVAAPRSVSISGKVWTPASASPGFDRAGSFSRWRCRVGRPAAEAALNHGPLAEPYRSQVLSLFTRRPK